MRVLILGASGMLGHKVYQQFKDRFETFATLRRNAGELASLPLYADSSHVIAGVDAMRFASVQSAIRDVRPDVIVNCIGVIKQVEDAHDMVRLVTLNALFPRQV